MKLLLVPVSVHRLLGRAGDCPPCPPRPSFQPVLKPSGEQTPDDDDIDDSWGFLADGMNARSPCAADRLRDGSVLEYSAARDIVLIVGSSLISYGWRSYNRFPSMNSDGVGDTLIGCCEDPIDVCGC